MSAMTELLDHDVVVIGAGAAGIAAGLRLAASPLKFLLLEARPRLGGRALTSTAAGYPLDLGCGWLHSADRNPWTSRLAAAGFTIDKTAPGWGDQSLDPGFGAEDQQAFGAAWEAFDEALAAVDSAAPDRPAADLLAPGDRFNALIGAIGTYISGAELDKVSALDLARYADTGVNWRVREGYGAGIVSEALRGNGLPVKLGCHVSRIEHAGRELRVVTGAGTLRAKAVVITVPPNLLVEGKLVFDPPLPDKLAAAAGLPLGLADKLVLKLAGPQGLLQDLPQDGHLFGRTDRVATASYHLRPFGRDLIEAYFAGNLAADLETEESAGFFAFAAEELARIFGSDFRARLSPLIHTAWGRDPYARGAYSYAVPGAADNRARLATPVDGRLFFAGEACSPDDFSTAHGAYLTGIAAAEAAMAACGNLAG